MELDDMKSAWLLLDRRLARHEALNLRAFREGRLDRLRRSLRPLKAGQIAQILAGALLALVFAPFWVLHIDTPHLVVVGVSLHVYALMFIVSGARDLDLLRRIDFSAPVVDIQRRLAMLRAWRIRVAPVFGAIGCVIWVPLMLWLFEVLFGVDVYALNPDVVWILVASGLGCLGLMLLFLKWAKQPRRERIAKYLEDSAAGRSIPGAQRFLDEVTDFAREA